MDDTPAPRLAETLAEAEDALLSRWPETRLEPSLDRIRALMELLGEPQRSFRTIHLTGTNGKTSTSRMVDALLRAVELRTGRFTSPHLESINERISVDGEPLSDEAFVRAFNDVAPYLALVDEDQPFPMSFFESVVGMAYAAFADAPVDVAVVEVGMGGTWDATNVVDGDVAVVLPIAVDHAKYLGGTPEAIAHEKAGIIKPGASLVVAAQLPEVAEVLLKQAAAVGATVAREGVEFGVVSRTPALGGQTVSLQGLRARYDDLFLPLYGAHQAQNAAIALAAVEAFLGGSEALSPDVVAAAFAQVSSPGRLEIVRRSPTVLLDAAHNPAGAEATAAALEDSFTFRPLVGVLGVMADKDVEELLVALEPQLDQVVCTQNSTPRCMPAAELAEVAVGVFGEDRVHVQPHLPDAIAEATALAESADGGGASIGSGAVLVTGSVITAGEARTLLAPRRPARSVGPSVVLTRGEETLELEDDEEGGGDLSEVSLEALLRDTLSDGLHGSGEDE
ncbi:folylpolyglutamate synthase/dihydrofolate synthase family protein [Nocardioides sp. GY 10127]|uniref:bifunctional tetrahydrofolate synthase/dihydrofolate synthase n=1 Tax=Nocardioides sp. GY 10127 TaxID=2569762 RepID=UPI0010A84A68|nr:folylpolyglutamate synthase/dihydrofolate synthase family protein [Nocardioides sp. GY 10127]TIC80744.1 bifunctional folylpolyglutamate synthase/dihydrofolate synthase [Nocardioides sp. GY 10127]